MRTALTLKNINVICTRKQFLIGSVGPLLAFFAVEVCCRPSPEADCPVRRRQQLRNQLTKYLIFPNTIRSSIEHASSVSLLPVTRIWRR